MLSNNKLLITFILVLSWVFNQDISSSKQSESICPPTNGEGTVSPDVLIYSITFVVNGVEQLLHDGDTLQATLGDTIEVSDVIICAESFSGDGGDACVDFVPVDIKTGEEIISEHAGTHMVELTSGYISIKGPSYAWIFTENWGQISAVLNHWPRQNTEDDECANKLCEHDDWAIIDLR